MRHSYQNRFLYCCGLFAVNAILMSPSWAIELDGESYSGSVDTTFSYGISSRVESADDDIIGIPNGGNAYSVNGDDGNLNFDEGVFSHVLKVTSEMQLDYQDYGLFVRGTAFYDDEIMGSERDHVALSQDAKQRVGRDIELLDAYIWREFSVQGKPLEVRVGNQVLSWGESTFIQNGINAINPVDVGRIRIPGSELREALQPVPILSASLGISENGSLDAFYQLQWQETAIDPSGSYFNTNDFAGDGGDRVQLGFGAVAEGDFLGVSRGKDRDARNEGQWGLAYHLYVPEMNDTEFGFYYLNYHSRLPVLSSVTGTATGLSDFQQVYTDFGVAPGTNSSVDAIATDAYARTAHYYFEYPENVHLFGVSFNTQLATSGIALQGELSYRQNVPLQIDDVELLFATLGPISNSDLSGGSPGLAELNQIDRVTSLETDIEGYIQRDVSQFQLTATKVFSQVFGASQMIVAGEFGYTHVHNMPDKDDLRLEAPGTYLGGNPALTSRYGPGAGQYETATHFADADSWGYRLVARFDYANAIASVNLMPRIAWAEDVHGNSPGPGGNFLEGRQALTLGVTADYLNQWSGDFSYTQFAGAGRYNLINDRDFIAFNLKYSF